MTRLRSLLVVAVLAALFALAVAAPAAAQDHGPAPTASHGETAGGGNEGGSGSTHDVVPVLVWSTAGIVASGILLSVFYLLKRRVGGFPANPAWVAPITIMQSKDFPPEGSYGDVPADAHGAHH